MAGLLERYLEGDRERVWQELKQLGAAVRAPEHLAAAEAVVSEAMARARRNVEALIERLRGQGYRFGDPFAEEERATAPLAPPDEHTPELVQRLEDRFGPLPLTARLWIEQVGDVSLLGVHPAWEPTCTYDPLVVEVEHMSWPHVRKDRLAVLRHVESEYECWAEVVEDGRGAFCLDVAPDALHKANISGGAPYGFLVPDACADATFRFQDDVRLPFVAYLGLAFAHGGFPGMWGRDMGERARRARRELADGLEPL